MAQAPYAEPGGTQRHATGITDQGTDESPKEKAKEQLSETARQAKDQAAQLAEKAKQQAKTQVAGQKDRATEQLVSIGSALHQTSENLRQENQDALAGYVGQAAQQVEKLSDYLRTRTVGELLSDAETYARREPALFLGGAMLLGLFGARFFKSSHTDSYQRRDVYRTRSRTRSYRPGTPRTYDEPYFGRTGQPEYNTVHGTAGAEMPDVDRTMERTNAPSQPSTSPGTPQEERRNL